MRFKQIARDKEKMFFATKKPFLCEDVLVKITETENVAKSEPQLRIHPTHPPPIVTLKRLSFCRVGTVTLRLVPFCATQF